MLVANLVELNRQKTKTIFALGKNAVVCALINLQSPQMAKFLQNVLDRVSLKC